MNLDNLWCLFNAIFLKSSIRALQIFHLTLCYFFYGISPKDTYEWSYPPPEQFRDLEDDPEEEEEEEEDEDESEDTKMHSILEADRSADEISPDARNRPGTSGKSMPPMPSKEGGDTLKSTENIPLNEDPDVAVKKVSIIYYEIFYWSCDMWVCSQNDLN